MRPTLIDPRLERASTLPRSAYVDASAYDRIVERALATSWHWVGDEVELPDEGGARPATLLPGSLDEPIVITRHDGRLRALSNVCTHRARIVADEPCRGSLRCRYHGRRFGLDGKLLSAPGFEGACDFPTAGDDLPEFAVTSWQPFVFASVSPEVNFETAVRPFRDRIGWILDGPLSLDDAASCDYEVNASFLLYVDNYLEGFHVPYVHPGLNAAIDWSAYTIEVFEYGTLQVARAKPNEPAFELPAGHPDAGARVAAYYAFLFPTTMLNVYPWGVSLNVVMPLGPSRTRVAFRAYVRDRSLRSKGAGADLHQVEREDEAVVESAARGVRSRAWKGGRFSPAHEAGVHWFHSRIARALEGGPPHSHGGRSG